MARVRSVVHQGELNEFFRSPQMVATMRSFGSKIGRVAVATSNVDTRIYVDRHGFRHPGHYKRSWHLKSGVRNGKAWARTWNTALYSGYLEYGTTKMRAYRVLRRAVATVESRN